MISTHFLKRQLCPYILPFLPISKDISPPEAIRTAAKENISYFLVRDGDVILGVIKMKSMLEKIHSLESHSISDFVCTNFCIINKDQLHLLDFQEISSKYAAVYENGSYIGILDLEFNNHYYDSLIRDTTHFIDLILDSCYNGIIALDEHRNIIILNQSAAGLYRVKAEEVIDKPLESAIPDSPLNQYMFESGPDLGFKCRLHDSTLIANRTPIIVNGTLIGGVSIFQDITSDELTIQELSSVRENEKYLESIIENSYDGIYITDKDGRTLRVNRSYERITGLSSDRLVGKYMKDLVDEGLLSIHITDTVVSMQKPVTLNQTVSNGKELIITGSPIYDDNGEVSKVITNVRDITELIHLEKELKISKETTHHYQKALFDGTDNIVCKSKEFNASLKVAKQVAGKASTVLILGETGTGKEIVARYIHASSERSKNNYIKINCGAIPANLLESELFGYVGGAFTGANPKGKTGMFELANHGTLFLDEIGEMPLDLQSSLLRVLQDGEVRRVGDSDSRKVDVRIIAATNRNLEEMILKGTFRSDLFYRLNVVSIVVPPLRDRPDDIPYLAEHFLAHLNQKYGDKKVLTLAFVDQLMKMDWPGNIRELSNFIEKQFVMSESDFLDTFVPGYQPEIMGGVNSPILINGIMNLPDAVRMVESTLITRAMQKFHSTHKAAKVLGMSQPTFFRKYKEYCVAGEELPDETE